MTKIEARKILYTFAAFCRNRIYMSEDEFELVCKNPDFAFSENSELCSELFELDGVSIRPKEIIESFNMCPEVVSHIIAWVFGGGSNGRGRRRR